MMDKEKTVELLKTVSANCELKPLSDCLALEQMFKASLPLELWILLSFKDGIIGAKNSLSQMRIMSLTEIQSAPQELQVDFPDKGLLPLIDCLDNDFLVYDVARQNYSLFNIVDEVSFNSYSSLCEFLQKKA